MVISWGCCRHWALKPVLGVYGCHEERSLFLGTSVILMIQAGVVPTGCETAKSQWNTWPWSSSGHGEWLQDIGSRTAIQKYKWTVRADHGSCLVADISPA